MADKTTSNKLTENSENAPNRMEREDRLTAKTNNENPQPSKALDYKPSTNKVQNEPPDASVQTNIPAASSSAKLSVTDALTVLKSTKKRPKDKSRAAVAEAMAVLGATKTLPENNKETTANLENLEGANGSGTVEKTIKLRQPVTENPNAVAIETSPKPKSSTALTATTTKAGPKTKTASAKKAKDTKVGVVVKDSAGQLTKAKVKMVPTAEEAKEPKAKTSTTPKFEQGGEPTAALAVAAKTKEKKTKLKKEHSTNSFNMEGNTKDTKESFKKTKMKSILKTKTAAAPVNEATTMYSSVEPVEKSNDEGQNIKTSHELENSHDTDDSTESNEEKTGAPVSAVNEMTTTNDKDLHNLLSNCRELILHGQHANALTLADKAAKLAAEAAIDVYEKVTVEEYDEKIQNEAKKGFVSPSGMTSQRLGQRQRKWDTAEDAYLKKRQVSETRRRKKDCLAELMYWNETLVVNEEKKEEEEKRAKQKKVTFDEISSSTSISLGKGKKKKKRGVMPVADVVQDHPDEGLKGVVDAGPHTQAINTQGGNKEENEKTDISSIQRTKKQSRKAAEAVIKQAHSCKKACLKQLLLTVKKRAPQTMHTMKQQRKAATLIQQRFRGFKEMKKQRYAFMQEQFKLAAGRKSRMAISKRQAEVRKLNKRIAAEEKQYELAVEELTTSLATTHDDLTLATAAHERKGCAIVTDEVEEEAELAVFSFTDGCTNLVEALGWWNYKHQVMHEVGHHDNSSTEAGGFNPHFMSDPEPDDTKTKDDTTLGDGKSVNDDEIIQKYAGPTTFKPSGLASLL